MQPAHAPADEGWRFTRLDHCSSYGRWALVEATPRGPLSAYIEQVWATESAGVFTRQDILPRTPTEVLFALGQTHWLRGPAGDQAWQQAWISGLQTAPLWVESPAAACMAGIRLRPAGVAAFLRDSPTQIAGAVVDLTAVLGPGVENLRHQLATTPELQHRVALLAAAVERHLAPARSPSALVLATLAALQNDPTQPVHRLVAAAGVSHRHLTTRFCAEIGLTPKTYARIRRFESAFAQLQNGERVSWARFALAAGYANQAHLIHEFQAFAGATPTEVLRRKTPDGLGLGPE